MQFHPSADAVEASDRPSAERQLWCAVIERALHDATDGIAAMAGPGERSRIRDDARAWFMRNGREFRHACESAGFDPDYLRSHVLPLIVREPPG